MRTPAASALSDLGLKLTPEDGRSEKIQRISPSGQSYVVKEGCMSDPDEALVLQSQAGDLAAFEMLVRKHQRMIHSLTFRMTGSLADAEDLAQEAFIRAYRAASKFSTWLYRIAINVCLTWRQRETRRAEVHVSWNEGNGAPQGTPENSPAADLSDRVHAALLKLPAKQRAAITLVVYDGLNHAEAAEILNCSEATVSWRIFAARRKLRRWLDKGLEEA